MKKACFCTILLLSVMLCGWLSAAQYSFAEAKYPAAAKSPKTNGKLRVDANHTKEGYFLASISKKSNKKMKMRVIKGKVSLTYDLNSKAEYECFPFQLGNGKYEISLYENVSGKKYTAAGKITVNVKLSDENGPFLYPNQYVNYTATTKAVLQADKMCKDLSPKKAFNEICSFMKSSFVYDFVKAATIKAGELPDIDGSYDKHMGVCQDLSAIMIAMLRSQGIPSKLMIGYAGKQYHAWTVTIIDGEEVFYDPTAALNAINKEKTYTVERYY